MNKKSTITAKEVTKTKFKRTLWDEIKYYGFYKWSNFITDLKYKIPNYFERAKYGVGDADTWDFDIYLAEVIVRGVKNIKKHQQGIPTDIYKKYQKRKDLSSEEKERLAKIEWQEILSAITTGFELVPELFEEQVLKNKKLQKQHMSKLDRAFDLLKKHYFSLWD